MLLKFVCDFEMQFLFAFDAQAKNAKLFAKIDKKRATNCKKLEKKYKK